MLVGTLGEQVISHGCHLILSLTLVARSSVYTLQRFYLIVPKILGHTWKREVLGYKNAESGLR